MVPLPATLGYMAARSDTCTVRGSGAGTAFHRTSYPELAPLPTAVPCGRLHAIHVLHEWGLWAIADDAALVVSDTAASRSRCQG